MTAEPVTGRPDPVLVEYADRTGRGFSLLDQARRRTEVAALQEVAAALVRSTVEQPKVDTGSHPVHGLLQVTSGGRAYWCFHVQGRRGPFGAAGTCQFVFGDTTTWSPGELWAWGSQHCLGGLVRVDVESQEVPSGGSVAVADGVLRDLAAGRMRIALDHDPQGVAALLTGLLPTLPHDVVARYWWRTCLLERPTTTNQSIVAGGWPDDLRALQARHAELVDAWLDKRHVLPGVAPVTLPKARENALVWLAKHVVGSGPRIRPDAEVRGMGELLDWIGTTELPIEAEQVEGYLAQPRLHQRLAASADVVAQWGRDHPQQARTHLVEKTGGDEIQKALLAGMWKAAAKDGRNELCIPPSPEPVTGWRHRLATVIRMRHPDDPAAIVDDLVALRHVGVALVSHEDLVAARNWLGSLDLTPETHPQFFPDSPDDLRERLAGSGSLSAQDREKLLDRGDNLLDDLKTLAPEAQRWWPSAAAELVGLLVEAGRPDDVGPLTIALIDVPEASPERFVRLADAVAVHDEGIRRDVLRFGLRALATARPTLELPADLDRRCAAALAGDVETVPAEVRYLLRRLESLPSSSGTDIEAAPTAPEPVTDRPGPDAVAEVDPSAAEPVTDRSGAEAVAAVADPPEPSGTETGSRRVKKPDDVERHRQRFTWKQKVALVVFIALAVVLIAVLAVAIVWTPTGAQPDPTPPSSAQVTPTPSTGSPTTTAPATTPNGSSIPNPPMSARSP
ncbi:MAG: hypothetical protein ACRDTC_04150 [Pseudonocardiaceae bacterium]